MSDKELYTIEEVVNLLRSAEEIRKHISTAPSFDPRNRREQVQFWTDGVSARAYFNINNAWWYVDLTKA